MESRSFSNAEVMQAVWSCPLFCGHCVHLNEPSSSSSARYRGQFCGPLQRGLRLSRIFCVTWSNVSKVEVDPYQSTITPSRPRRSISSIWPLIVEESLEL